MLRITNLICVYHNDIYKKSVKLNYLEALILSGRKKVDKVLISIWHSLFFIVHFKCSMKEGVGGLETTLSQGVKA